METSETALAFDELLDASALTDDDFLAVSQQVYNPITSENGDTRKIKVKKLLDYILQKTNLADLPGNAESIGKALVSKTELPFFALSSPFIIANGRRTLTLKAGTKIDYGTGANKKVFLNSEDMELNVPTLLDTGYLQNGKDYYIFVCPGDTIKISLTKAAPLGMNAADVKLMAGFHTLCLGVNSGLTYVEGGVSKPHPLAGYAAGDILPNTVWCLNFRPHSEPEGMVYIPSLDFWCDIYLQSGSGVNTKSAYKAAPTLSRQYVDHVEDMICVKKELLDDGEFAAAMMGSNEQTNIVNSNFPGDGVGGHSDTAGRRMISIYGVEEGCGWLWQWLRTTSVGGLYGQTYGQNSAQNVTPVTYGYLPASPGNMDQWYGQSEGKGQFLGLACALVAGGYWSDGANCGSRSRYAGSSRSTARSSNGGRGRSRCVRAKI